MSKGKAMKMFLYLALLFVIGIKNTYAQKIEVNGLFKNSAIVTIDGKQHVLKVGKKYKSGITLISANAKEAVISVKGKKQTYRLSNRIAQTFTVPRKKQLRINSGQHGHYFYRGSINGFSVDFLVDTGASSIAINANTAKRLGISRRMSRGNVYVNTANAKVTGYLVTLREVKLGAIVVNNIEAVIMPNEYPEKILLGNSFLSKCDIKIENGVLVLTSKI